MEKVSKNNGKSESDGLGSSLRLTLRKAKRWLDNNALTEIAEEVGCSPKTVGNQIHKDNKRPNMLIVQKIIERAEHNKQLKQRAESL
jgi:DNA-binding CsgD family transcriptional regulator